MNFLAAADERRLTLHTEPAPQELSTPSHSLANPRSVAPVGAAPLPEEVLMMVNRLKVGGMQKPENDRCIDLLERMAARINEIEKGITALPTGEERDAIALDVATKLFRPQGDFTVRFQQDLLQFATEYTKRLAASQDIAPRLPEGCMWVVTKGGRSICQPPRSFYQKEFIDEQLTMIYNTANNIGEGKAPPITTQRIFTAMRVMPTAIPDGMVLVPKEPTEAMLNAAEKEWNEITAHTFGDLYRTMIHAGEKT